LTELNFTDGKSSAINFKVLLMRFCAGKIAVADDGFRFSTTMLVFKALEVSISTDL
jgi:hypothetical protein